MSWFWQRCPSFLRAASLTRRIRVCCFTRSKSNWISQKTRPRCCMQSCKAPSSHLSRLPPKQASRLKTARCANSAPASTKNIPPPSIYLNRVNASSCHHVQGDAAKVGFMVMPVLSKVLEQLCPTDFQSYADFRASCSNCISSIGHIVVRLTTLPPCLACKLDNNTKLLQAHMAHVRGCLRRALEPEEQFFSATEYAGLCAPLLLALMHACVGPRCLQAAQQESSLAAHYMCLLISVSITSPLQSLPSCGHTMHKFV